MSIDVSKFARLEWFFWDLVNRMKNVPRWVTKEHPVHTAENVLEHSFKTWMLTLLVALLEKRAGNNQLDVAWLMIRAPGHDLEESSGLGDQNYFVRHHPRLKHLFDQVGEIMIQLFLGEHLPQELADELFHLLTSDENHEKEVKLFYYIEHIGYLTFALYEVQEAKNLTFYKVFSDHFDTLEKGAQEFPNSIGVIWSGMKPKVTELLANRPK